MQTTTIMSTEVFNKDLTTQSIERVSKLVLDTVGSTLGPFGKTVGIKFGNNVTLTKDGVSVLKQILPKEDVDSLIATLIRQSSDKTVLNSGDGTTSTAVLTTSLILEGLKLIKEGASFVQINKELKVIQEKLIEVIDQNKKEITVGNNLKNIALQSTNQDKEISNLIYNAFEAIGDPDRISIYKNSKALESFLEIKEGHTFFNVYSHPYLLDNPVIKLDNVKVLFLDESPTEALNSFTNHLFVIINHLLLHTQEPLAILCSHFDTNSSFYKSIEFLWKQTNNVHLVSLPKMTDEDVKLYQKDLCVLTGADLLKLDDLTKLIVKVGNDYQLSDEGYNKLGLFKNFKMTQYAIDVTFSPNEDTLNSRIKELKERTLDKDSSESFKKKMKRQLEFLTTKHCVINVAAPTDSALEEKLYRVDDGLRSCQSALKEGITFGGGSIYLLMRNQLETIFEQAQLNTSSPTFTLLNEALASPFFIINKNAGRNYEDTTKLLEEIVNDEKAVGYDVLGESFIYKDFSSPIIDPAIVCKDVINNAIAVTIDILSLSSTIIGKHN